jgi:hypothetical protein
MALLYRRFADESARRLIPQGTQDEISDPHSHQ